MHDYAIFEHDRAAIGRWLGVFAILISGGISQVFIISYNLTGLEAFSKAIITTSVVYFILHWIFNHWVWKLPFFKIPNLASQWNVKGKTLNEDGSIKYEWDAIIAIEQTWKNIAICLKTAQSQSFSQTATLEKQHGFGGWLLSYSYKNEPRTEQSHELNAHKGYCQIEINTDITIGDASYFNNNGRRTVGTMTIERRKND